MSKAKANPVTPYEFRYLKKGHDIDLNTFLTSQQNFLTIIHEINRTSFPEASVNVKITQPRPGSFIIEHLIDIVPIGVFVSENWDRISTLFTVLKDFIDIWKLLKGDKAKKVTYVDNSVTIVVDGNKNTFHADAFKIYQSNTTVNKAIFKGTAILNGDKEIEGFEVKKQGAKKPLIQVKREELQAFQNPNKYLDKPERTKEIKEATLFVKKFDVAPKKSTKFTFYYDGRPISASIEDGHFLQRIMDGEKFGNGDSLVVELEVSKKFDEGYDTYIVDKHTILNVKDIHRRGQNPDQTNLFEQ
jgi:hypothetical protein